jgi:hypothetical protein
MKRTKCQHFITSSEKGIGKRLHTSMALSVFTFGISVGLVTVELSALRFELDGYKR